MVARNKCLLLDTHSSSSFFTESLLLASVYIGYRSPENTDISGRSSLLRAVRFGVDIQDDAPQLCLQRSDQIKVSHVCDTVYTLLATLTLMNQTARSFKTAVIYNILIHYTRL